MPSMVWSLRNWYCSPNGQFVELLLLVIVNWQSCALSKLASSSRQTFRLFRFLEPFMTPGLMLPVSDQLKISAFSHRETCDPDLDKLNSFNPGVPCISGPVRTKDGSTWSNSPVSWYRLRILLTHPCETLNLRLISHGRMPLPANLMISWRMAIGSGRPLMKMPPSWFTRPWKSERRHNV